MKKPFPGMECGCSDSDSVDHETMSRLYDMLYSAYRFGGEELKMKVWNTLVSESDKLDFIYGKWSYQEQY